MGVELHEGISLGGPVLDYVASVVLTFCYDSKKAMWKEITAGDLWRLGQEFVKLPAAKEAQLEASVFTGAFDILVEKGYVVRADSAGGVSYEVSRYLKEISNLVHV